MSDPKCKTCMYFTKCAFDESGECGDPQKTIRDSNSNPINSFIGTWGNYSCNNHKPKVIK
jgi:hypothetical protein